jgi:tRNA A-37 threonylcarbamoyl transferase component Bud32/RNA polymerase subunit RPABC4/transcription elongation factor Spt4
MKKCSSCGAAVSPSAEKCPSCGTEMRDAGDDLIGVTLADKYMIEEKLGTGGMCYVYSGRHVMMGKRVAIKVLKPELAADPKISERFEQEAHASSRIHHPHAINVTDFGGGPGARPFIIMELVEGRTLGEMLRDEGAMPVERAANILRQACGALDAAHSVGVIHRDIKPDNIIISSYDGSDWVKVVDFGVAKIQEDVNRRAQLTGANIIVGTPRYMSPEQCEEQPVDRRSDIYSLGVVLYEMLTGEAPFPGNSSTRLLMAHTSQPPPPLRGKRPDLSPELEAVVMRALEKSPDRRPQTAGEFAQQFEQAAGLGQVARTGADRAGGFSRIAVPLGEDPGLRAREQAAAPPALDDEATLVRPRSARSGGVDTPAYQRAGGPYSTDPQLAPTGPRYSTPPGGTAYAPAAYDYQGRGNAGLVIGIIAVVLVVAGVVGYLVFGDRLFGGSSGNEVIDAERAVTDAIARVESLPPDHPLRTYLPQLAKWQGELGAYQQVQNYTPQTMQVAERYRIEAEKIAGQARAALASSREAPTNVNTNRDAAPPAASGSPAGDERMGLPPPPPPAEGNKNASEDPEEEEEGQENNNRKKERRSDPPVLDPVKPQPPSNSNRPRNERPPNV